MMRTTQTMISCSRETERRILVLQVDTRARFSAQMLTMHVRVTELRCGPLVLEAQGIQARMIKDKLKSCANAHPGCNISALG